MRSEFDEIRPESVKRGSGSAKHLPEPFENGSDSADRRPASVETLPPFPERGSDSFERHRESDWIRTV